MNSRWVIFPAWDFSPVKNESVSPCGNASFIPSENMENMPYPVPRVPTDMSTFLLLTENAQHVLSRFRDKQGPIFEDSFQDFTPLGKRLKVGLAHKFGAYLTS